MRMLCSFGSVEHWFRHSQVPTRCGQLVVWFGLFGTCAGETSVKIGSCGFELQNSLDGPTGVAKAFIARVAQSLMPKQLFCPFPNCGASIGDAHVSNARLALV